MVLATINHVRYLPWFGLAASSLIVLTGLFDIVRFTGLGVLEVAIGVAAAVVSLVSLAGMYRKDAAVTGPTSDASRRRPADAVAAGDSANR